MAYKVALFTIHGMGNPKEKYSEELIKNLKKEMGAENFDKFVHHKDLQFQSPVHENQARMWEAMGKKIKPGFMLRRLWGWVREFFMFYFSDAVTIGHKAHRDDRLYNECQRAIKGQIEESFAEIDSQPLPTVVVAYSLGAYVLSNYIWDAHNQKFGIWKKEEPDDEADFDDKERFVRFRTLDAFHTIGCNIPYFVAGHPEENIEPIDEEGIGRKITWRNYYDDDDILGWPLKPISERYGNLVTDINIVAGQPWYSFTPLSHLGYWKNRVLAEDVAERLEGMIRGG